MEKKVCGNFNISREKSVKCDFVYDNTWQLFSFTAFDVFESRKSTRNGICRAMFRVHALFLFHICYVSTQLAMRTILLELAAVP